MNLDNEKIDEAVLALLLLGLHDGSHAKTKSIVFTEEGMP